jgi:hypothetical protein
MDEYNVTGEYNMAQEILDFINAFLDAEHEALIAQYTEHDKNIFEGKKAILERFLSCGVESELSQPLSPDEAWFENGRRIVESGSLIPRMLFQIKIYDHPVFATLYRAYVSLNSLPIGKRSMYFANFFAADTDEGLKIVSRYDIDMIPDQEGVRLKDASLSWIWHSGKQISTLGKLVKTYKFKAPDNPEHLIEYQFE